MSESRDAWMPITGSAAPPRPRTALLRSTRRASEVALDADGRIAAQPDHLAGLSNGTPEEIAEAASIVEQARGRADQLVRAAIHRAEVIEQQAHDRGRELGYGAGLAAAHAEIADALALVQRAAGEAKAMRDQLYTAAEPDLIELVIESMHAILGDRIASDALLVTETVRRALERAGRQNVMRIRVHSDESERIEAWLVERHGEVQPYQVVGDHAIAIGGCIVDTHAGFVDARLDVQLDEVARLLRDALPPRDVEGREAGDAA